jgi:hypothetical protein
MLRFLHRSKPKPGLPGTLALRASLRQQGIAIFQSACGTAGSRALTQKPNFTEFL